MGKRSGSGSGMNNPDHISKSLETILWVNFLRSGIRNEKKIWIRDGKNSDPGKHPGSATLEQGIVFLLQVIRAVCYRPFSHLLKTIVRQGVGNVKNWLWSMFQDMYSSSQ
jgi:hypothetical protein